MKATDTNPRRKAGKKERKPDVPHNLTVEERRQIALAICARVANGEYLGKICKEPGMPHTQTFWNWRNEDAVVFAAYAHAQEARAERLADQVVEVADEKPNHFIDDKGRERIDPGSVAHQKLRMDARKWVAAKLLPKRYGERIELGGKLTHEVVPPDVVLDKVRTMSPVLANLTRGKN